jgi:hypothetical protein
VFSARLDRRFRLFVAVFAASSTVGGAFGLYALWPAHREAGYEPDQPLAFSHRRHAGELKIDCRYCHWTVDTAAHAAVPRLSVCMRCHRQVQPKDSQGNVRRELAKLLEAWEQGRPIAWENVHILADFVHFDHSRHLAAGLECQRCHGPVEGMERLRRWSPLVMGWCLDCHRVSPAEPRADGLATQAPDNCTACHR